MADTHLKIAVGDSDVDSKLVYDASHPNRTLVRITSQAGAHTVEHQISIEHRAGYTQAQAEYDIEQARWRSAARAAGTAHVRTLLPSILSTTTPATARRLTAPEHKQPS